MTSYDAWLDPEEVKRLAGQLLEPAPAAAAKPPGDPSFGADFVGFAGDEPEAQFSSAPVPSGIDGLRQRFVHGMFLLDERGEAVFEEGEAKRLQSLALDFARSTAESRRGVRLKIDALRWLELVPIDSPESRRVFGAIVTEPLDAAALQRIEAALGGEVDSDSQSSLSTQCVRRFWAERITPAAMPQPMTRSN
jgi:hypothetical protein